MKEILILTAETMYLAYSALRENSLNADHTPTQNNRSYKLQNTNPKLKGYLAACAKYSRELAAIQQHIPGWMPCLPNL